MANVLQTASAWLQSMRKAHASGTVLYSRAGASADVSASIGKTMFEQVDSNGVAQRTESRDYLITAADLVLSGLTVLPQRGDRITEGDYVYEVLAPGNEPVWQWADQWRLMLRVHTKLVDQS